MKSRVLERVKFLKRNKALCKKAFAPKEISKQHPRGVQHSDWKYPSGRTLLAKARLDIGYSESTANCDIFWSLMGLYNWLIQEKII